MKQIIQKLHANADVPKGFLLDAVKAHLDAKHYPMDTSPLETDLYELINIDSIRDDVKAELKQRLSKINLLSEGAVNPKTAKQVGIAMSNWILHLTPSNLAGVNMCPKASRGCRAACLNGAGRGLFDGVQLPRLRKTLYFVHFRKEFLAHLDREINKIQVNALKNKERPVIRLNGTSDLTWESFQIRDGKNLFELYPNVTFYDYTKIILRLRKLKLNPLPNYSLTFSESESNGAECLEAIKLGYNVAVVFFDVPKQYGDFEVIDGDSHDFRFLDAKQGVIVGLKAKGPARKDVTGFVKGENKKVAKTA